MSFLTLLDIQKRNGSESDIGLIEEVGRSAPEVTQLASVVGSKTMMDHRQNLCTHRHSPSPVPPGQCTHRLHVLHLRIKERGTVSHFLHRFCGSYYVGKL